MYIEQDFVGPATLDLQANRRMQNRLLRYWPTKLVGTVVVLDRLYLYNGTVQESDSHKKIYNILGVSLEDLKAEKWKGIQNYYMYFNVEDGTQDNITNAQLDTYIQYQSPFTVKSIPEALEFDRSEWFESELSYEPLKVDTLSNALSDSEIVAKVIADPYILEYSVEDEHAITALALLDTNEVIFERSFRVTHRGLTEVISSAQAAKTNAGTFVKEVNIEFRFRRKPMTTQLSYDMYLGSVRTNMANATGGIPNSLRLQLQEVYRSIVPFVDNDILYNAGLINPETGYILAGEAYYKKDGLQAMKSREFNKTITARIKTGYTKKKVSSWKKMVTIVITIIIIVIAVILSPVTAGGSLAAAATMLTIGSLAMMGLSIILAKSDPAWAAYIGKASQVLGIAATITGVVAIVQSMGRTAIAGKLTDEAGKQLAKDGVVNASKEAIKQKAFEMAGQLTFKEAIEAITFDSMQDMLVEFVKSSFNSATSFNMQSMMNLATKGFQMYTKYIDPPADGLDKMARELEEQEQALEDLSSAGLKDKIDYTFSSPLYNIYDFNEIMQAIPHRLTQGKIDDTFNKYYDGVASKVTYRGYLG